MFYAKMIERIDKDNKSPDSRADSRVVLVWMKVDDGRLARLWLHVIITKWQCEPRGAKVYKASEPPSLQGEYIHYTYIL